MVKLMKGFVVSIGALVGGAIGFYFLEDYKIKAKEQRLALLLEKKREFDQVEEQQKAQQQLL